MESHTAPTETTNCVLIRENIGGLLKLRCRCDQSVLWKGRKGAEISNFDLNDDADNGVINELLGVKY
jgi:hypothetical protein